MYLHEQHWSIVFFYNKRFGFSVSIKSAVIEVKDVCHCDLGISPVPAHLRSLSGCVTVVRGGSLRAAMSPKPRGGRALRRAGRRGARAGWACGAMPFLQLFHCPPNPKEAFKPSHGKGPVIRMSTKCHPERRAFRGI